MKILLYPDTRLRAPNAALGEWSEEAALNVQKMKLLMSSSDGLGIAAPQVGWNVRLFVMRIPIGTDGDGVDLVAYNPIVETSGVTLPMKEGCLSIPGVFADIERYTAVRLVAETPDGRIDQWFEGLRAQVIQHEMDHLDGILFIDRMTPEDRERAEPLLAAFRERKD